MYGASSGEFQEKETDRGNHSSREFSIFGGGSESYATQPENQFRAETFSFDRSTNQ